MNERDDLFQTESEFRDEIEEMAEARVEVEKKLRERDEELDKIGDFGQATCISFEKGESVNTAMNRSEEMTFLFKFPDGSVITRSFNLSTELDELRQFLDSYDADSITDMVGATHACIYKDSGWELCERQNVRPWLYWNHVSGDGSLTTVWLPLPVAYITSLFSSLFCSVIFVSKSGLLGTLGELSGFVFFTLGAIGIVMGIALLDEIS